MASAREEVCIADRFYVGDRIGSGSFGDVFEGKCLRSGKHVAIKVEPTSAKYPMLLHECRIYKTLNSGDSEGIPELLWCGTQGAYHIMVTDLLGASLDSLHNSCQRRFSLSTTLQLAGQLLTRIEYIHSLGILHRDIKPENILLGKGLNSYLVYFIDFGLSKRFRNPRTGDHQPMQVGCPLVGTARYASINSHLGCEQSRRDDLESIGYLLVYLWRGRLPWQGMSIPDNDTHYAIIGNKKMDISLEELCEGLPEEFVEYLQIVRAMDYDEEPDYAALRRLFRNALIRLGSAQSLRFDWACQSPASEEGLSSEEDEEDEQEERESSKE